MSIKRNDSVYKLQYKCKLKIHKPSVTQTQSLFHRGTLKHIADIILYILICKTLAKWFLSVTRCYISIWFRSFHFCKYLSTDIHFFSSEARKFTGKLSHYLNVIMPSAMRPWELQFTNVYMGGLRRDGGIRLHLNLPCINNFGHGTISWNIIILYLAITRHLIRIQADWHSGNVFLSKLESECVKSIMRMCKTM